MLTQSQTLLSESYSSLPLLPRAWGRHIGGVCKIQEQQVGIDPIEFPEKVEVGEPVGVLVEGGLSRRVWGRLESCLGHGLRLH
jgi:hypothetical protein